MEAKNYLSLLDRIKLNVTGVKKIKSSDPSQTVLILDNTALVISGTNLSVENASIQTGEVEISGFINSIKYSSVSRKTRFSFKNMFK
ncbi:MAG: YabP/YqfC family sporulation protein [Christensenellaceae bacterium]|jgi:sporulation protein YabP|nr:YabP/YqfC family sporulation protein [Christensenellaceae bacterium]